MRGSAFCATLCTTADGQSQPIVWQTQLDTAPRWHGKPSGSSQLGSYPFDVLLIAIELQPQARLPVAVRNTPSDVWHSANGRRRRGSKNLVIRVTGRHECCDRTGLSWAIELTKGFVRAISRKMHRQTVGIERPRVVISRVRVVVVIHERVAEIACITQHRYGCSVRVRRWGKRSHHRANRKPKC